MNFALIRRLALTCPLLFCFASCAAMFTGTSSEVGFQSTPPGAQITIDEVEYTTPFSADVAKSTTAVTFSHPDYEPVEVELDRSFQGGLFLMDILFTPGFGISGIIVDSSTSAFYSMPSIVSFDFESGTILAGGERRESLENTEPVEASANLGEEVALTN